MRNEQMRTGRGRHRRSPVSVTVAATAMAVLVAVAAACSGSGPSGAEAGPGAGATPAPGAPAGGARRPFESLNSISEDKAKALHDSEEAAVARCMKDEGFTYTAQPYRPSTRPTANAPLGDVEAARQTGYGFTDGRSKPGGGGQPGNHTGSDDLAGLSPAETQAYRETLLGGDIDPELLDTGRSSGTHVVIPLPDGEGATSVDTASCVSRARSEVYGDDIEYQRLRLGVEGLTNGVITRTENDPGVTEAVGRWRECMRARGLDYERPGMTEKLAQELAERGTPADARRLEIDVAVADAECVREVAYLATFNAAVERFERESTETNEGLVLAFTEEQADAVERAQRTAGG